MRRSAIWGLAAAAALCASAVAADALRWELGFKHETPTWAKIKLAEDKTAIHWYMTYTVENKTGAVRKPSVRAEILTDTKKTHRDDSNPLVLSEVKKSLGVKEIATAGDLKKGIENDATVKCVATFGEVDKHAKKLELRVYGLMDPVTMVKGKEVYEVKYWQVVYERKGDEFNRTEDPWKVVSSGWKTEEPAAK
jgi:hypothetical protein